MATKRKRKAKKKSAKKPATQGVYRSFHGAFKLESDAKAKARKVKGFYIRRYIRGSRRFVVVADPVEYVPF